MDNLIVFLEGKMLEKECGEVEPIYSSKYSIVPLGNVAPLECKIDLPEVNPFIPDDLTVQPLGASKHPHKLYTSSYIDSFFK